MTRPARSLLLPAALITLAALPACDRTREPDVTADPARPPAPREQVHRLRATADHPNRDRLSVKPTEPTGPSDVAFDAPAAWAKVESPNPMRKATYRIPRVAPDTDDAELSVAQAGGTVDQNVARWAGQFGAGAGDVKREVRHAGGMRVTVVEIHGAYTAMAMPGAAGGDGAKGPKPAFVLLGAIVETSPPTFFKLTGPEKTVMAARADFDKLVEGMRAK